MVQQRNGRRGSVFSVRLTDRERVKLEALRALGEGPRSLGPWLVWNAIARVVPPPATTGEATTSAAGGVLPELRALKEVLPRRRRARVLPSRVILDLCAGSGAWSEPYRAAGYDVRRVTLPEDVRTFRVPSNVWGVLAAPPCDQFSLARNGCKSPRDLVGGMACVNACMRIVQQAKPRWWALENPAGLLSRFLGTPTDAFEPCDYGDPWTKRTALWGDFALPKRGPYVEPQGGGPPCRACPSDRRSTSWCSKPAHRAITPPGFARAFFEANP